MYANTFRQGIKRQYAIVFALIIREMTTRYGSKVGGYMWAILDPVLTITILTLVFSAVARVPPLGRSFALFFATGYLVFYMYRSLSDQVSLSVEVNRPLLMYPVVQIYDTIIARSTLQVITLFVVSLIMFGSLALVVPFERLDIYPIILASIISMTLGIGVGISNIVWFHLSGTYQQIWGIINRPAFIVSGVFFLPESIPQPFRDVLMWNPLVHIIGLFRTGFYPTYRASYVDLNYIIGLALFSVVTGLILVWKFEATLRELKK
ncbi:MAG: ABC transporter permease [Roseibium sp.]|uniref:ABC transporter permease n=1 Tax=Roseibium sp. TaxID=1936156 RepID=UPI002637C980|nr:ABC transporter permease [Roseibium sp.]MCV0429784.1 ABC transporter permease [Roseibium sp.]